MIAASKQNRIAGKPPANGHVKNRITPQPLEPVVTVANGSGVKPGPGPGQDPKPSSNQDSQGRFVQGNKAGAGNPNARKMAALRTEFMAVATPERVRQLAEKLFTLAIDGDLAASKLVLTYCLGRPPETVDPDRLDLAEWALLASFPSRAQALLACMDNQNPGFAVQAFRAGVPEGGDGAKKRLFGELTRSAAESIVELRRQRGLE